MLLWLRTGSRLPPEANYVCKTQPCTCNVPYARECVFGSAASCSGLIFYLSLPSLSFWPLSVLLPDQVAVIANYVDYFMIWTRLQTGLKQSIFHVHHIWFETFGPAVTEHLAKWGCRNMSTWGTEVTEMMCFLGGGKKVFWTVYNSRTCFSASFCVLF